MNQPNWSDNALPWDTMTGLNQFLSVRSVKPEILNDENYSALTPAERTHYDADRLRYMSRGITIKTSLAAAATKYIRLAADINDGGRFGLLISGQANVGKTTLCGAIMQTEYVAFTKRYPNALDQGAIPVVYIEVPSGSNGKQFLQVFLDFFQLTYKPAETQVNLQGRVIGALRQAGTKLVVIDEVHRLKGRTAGLGESIDVLRTLTRAVNATFVLAGIKLEDNKLFEGDRGAQLASRFSMLQLRPLGYSTADERKAWATLVRQIEGALPLRHHETGAMSKIAAALHRRTGGSIASLTSVLYSAAAEAIRSSKIQREALDAALIEAQLLDYGRQSALAKASAKKNAPLSLSAFLDIYKDDSNSTEVAA